MAVTDPPKMQLSSAGKKQGHMRRVLHKRVPADAHQADDTQGQERHRHGDHFGCGRGGQPHQFGVSHKQHFIARWQGYHTTFLSLF